VSQNPLKRWGCEILVVKDSFERGDEKRGRRPPSEPSAAIARPEIDAFGRLVPGAQRCPSFTGWVSRAVGAVSRIAVSRIAVSRSVAYERDVEGSVRNDTSRVESP
jgi:hypothetical protein